MSQISRVLRKSTSGYIHWCPGCDRAHHIPVDAPRGPSWSYDGNAESPTFNPSVRIFTPAQPAYEDFPAEEEKTICHYFIRSGMIEYCSDSAHELSGQTVPMVELSTIKDYGWGD